MQNDRHFVSAVSFGLGDPIVGIASLSALDLEMNAGKRLANDVR